MWPHCSSAHVAHLEVVGVHHGLIDILIGSNGVATLIAVGNLSVGRVSARPEVEIGSRDAGKLGFIAELRAIMRPFLYSGSHIMPAIEREKGREGEAFPGYLGGERSHHLRVEAAGEDDISLRKLSC